MATRDVSAEIGALDQTLASIEQVLDPDRMREQMAELEKEAAAPDLWDDLDRAQQVTTKLSYLQADLRRLTELRQ
ncbi:MAG TPA: peptide chain release factor 2, partial [Actinomycetota bacterium]|nr:peptide chain release factor 2 [Actinomycetota bacterium]